jgi:hypothetical protein
MSHSRKVNHQIKPRQRFAQAGCFEVQIDHVQSRIGKRNVFSMTAAPKFQLAIQKQMTQ